MEDIDTDRGWLPVIHGDTVSVNDSPARSDATVMSLPEQVLDVDCSLPASLVDEADCENLGSVAVSVNVQLGLKCVLMHQSYVSLVQYGVLRLETPSISIDNIRLNINTQFLSNVQCQYKNMPAAAHKKIKKRVNIFFLLSFLILSTFSRYQLKS